MNHLHNNKLNDQKRRIKYQYQKGIDYFKDTSDFNRFVGSFERKYNEEFSKELTDEELKKFINKNK